MTLPRLDAAWPDSIERPDTLPADLLGLVRLQAHVREELYDAPMLYDEIDLVVETTLDYLGALIRSGIRLTLPHLGTFHRVNQPGGPTVLFTPDPLLLEDSL